MARRSSLSVGVLAGVAAAGALGWLVATRAGRDRLGRLTGRRAAEEPEAPSFIELPAPDGVEALGVAPGAGEVVAAAGAEA